MKTRFLPFTLLLLTLSWNSLQAQWTGLGTGISAPPRSLFGLSVVNENIVWGFSWDEINIAPSKEFTRTLDGGQTWIPGFLDEVDAGLYSGHVFAFNADTAWLSTSSLQNPVTGKVYKTTDGGETWVWVDTLFNGFNQAPTAIHFFDAEKGVAFGAPFSAFYNNQILIYTTSDGGNSWTEVAVPAQLAGEGITDRVANGVYAAIGSEIWFPSTKGRVFKSSDYGNTWAAYQAPLQGATPHDPISIAMKDPLNGLLISDNPNEAFRTTDGGETWIPIAFPSQPAAFQVEYIPETEGTYIIHDGFFHNSPDILVTYDDGESWQIIATNVSMESLEFLSPTLGFGCTAFTHPNFGGMYKWSGPSLSGRIFVNDDAIGANTGYNWADAFTDLQSAFAIAEAGDQIWVAEGTYKPAAAGGSPTATFLIDKNLQLYGGFVGTETSLSQRGDPAEHPSVMSGDLNGDDVEGDFVNFKEDNVMTVMTATADVTNETVVDGFTIRNGHADGATNDQQQNGAGIYSLGAPKIKNCQFDQSYALLSGGGLYFFQGGSNGAIVEKCRFNKNRADNEFNGGGGLYAGGVSGEGVTVHKCEFNGNEGGRGGGLGSYNSNLQVTNSLFSGNTNIRQGGGLWFWGGPPAVTLELDSCTFENNHSSFGGGLYASVSSMSGANITNSIFSGNMVTPNNMGWGQSGGGIFIIAGGTINDDAFATIKNTEFIGNSSSAASGGLGIGSSANSTNLTVEIDNCYFSQNSAARGGALSSDLNGSGVSYTLSNSTFEGNSTTGDYATAFIWTFSPTTAMPGTAVVDNCIFQNNNSIFTGGLDIGSGQDSGPFNFAISNSSFLNNHADRFGGGLDIWGDGGSKPTFTIENCLVEGNSADERGGGMWILTSSQDFKATMKNCRILNNQSPKGAGIAAFLSELNLFTFPTNAQFKIENSLISGNSGDVAIELDSFPDFQLLNCTIADNNGGGIEISDQSSMSLQNTILANPGHTEYTAATPDVTVTSNGGNLVLDSSLNAVLTALDKPGTAPDFMSGTYEPSATSPLVNAGVNAGVTATTDLAGNDRIRQGIVDIGAYESPFVNSAREVVVGEIGLSPNPATHLLYLVLPAQAKPTRFDIFDAQGRLVQAGTFSEGKNLRVGQLPVGVFTLKMTDGERVYVGRFVKQ